MAETRTLQNSNGQQCGALSKMRSTNQNLKGGKNVKEWEVHCEWCGAKEGEPCVNNINGPTTEIYDKYIHISRAKLYDKKHGLNFLDRPRLSKEEMTFKQKKK